MSAVTDTIHTVVYDTVHTVSFDTVHVLMDSSITIQALKDSQTFYSNSFYWLLGVAGIAAAIIILVATKMWDRKVELEVDKLKKDCEKISAETVNKALEKAKIEFSGVAEKETKSIKRETNGLWNSTFFALLASTRNDRNDLYVISTLCELLKNSIGRIDEKLSMLIMSDLLPELENRVETLELADKFDSFIMASQEHLNQFGTTVTNFPVSESDKKIISEKIKKINSVINSKLGDYYKAKYGEVSGNRNRLQVGRKRF